jgi:hypothetical protein
MPVTRSISKSVRVSEKAVEPAAELNNVSPNHNPQGVKPVVRTRAYGTLFCWVIYYYYSSSNNNNNNNNNNDYYYYHYYYLHTPSVCVINNLNNHNQDHKHNHNPNHNYNHNHDDDKG